jgi:hypothetical protein
VGILLLLTGAILRRGSFASLRWRAGLLLAFFGRGIQIKPGCLVIGRVWVMSEDEFERELKWDEWEEYVEFEVTQPHKDPQFVKFPVDFPYQSWLDYISAYYSVRRRKIFLAADDWEDVES